MPAGEAADGAPDRVHARARAQAPADEPRAEPGGLLKGPATVARHWSKYQCPSEIPDGATEFKCAPPIRERANNELLWEALKDGTLDFVATDHSPAPPDIKEQASGNFMKIVYDAP